MREIKTTEAAGHILCHDMTQIIRGVTKGPRFRKGHVVREEDISVLLSMGKESLFVWEKTPGLLHEDEAAERLRALCQSENMSASGPKEGKIELSAEADGLLWVDTELLDEVNDVDELMIASRRSCTPVRRGDKLAGMRVIPLVIAEERLKRAEDICQGKKILKILPYKLKKAALIATGSEVAKGLIKDTFTPVVEEKLSLYGIETLWRCTPGDDRKAISEAVVKFKEEGAEIVICTGGMSVDPDDRTPGAIKDSGAEVVTYGAPVLPGAMFMLAYFEDGTPVVGLPGCVMYARTTIFDLLLPRLACGLRVSRRDIKRLGAGGLCLGCPVCHFPNCAFGRG